MNRFQPEAAMARVSLVITFCGRLGFRRLLSCGGILNLKNRQADALPWVLWGSFSILSSLKHRAPDIGLGGAGDNVGDQDGWFVGICQEQAWRRGA